MEVTSSIIYAWKYITIFHGLNEVHFVFRIYLSSFKEMKTFVIKVAEIDPNFYKDLTKTYPIAFLKK